MTGAAVEPDRSLRRWLGTPARWLGELLAAAAPRPGAHVAEVTPWGLRRGDGVAVAALRCGDLDVTALDPGEAAAVTAAFGGLCRSLEAPLQLLVQVRSWRPGGAPTVPTTPIVGVPGPAPPRAHGSSPIAPLALRLAGAEEGHEHRLLAARRVYRRSVVVVAAAADGRAPTRARDMAAGALAAAGVETSPLSGAELAAVAVDSGLVRVESAGRDGLAAPAWSSSRTALSLPTGARLGIRLRDLPGVAVAPGWLAPILRMDAECDVAVHLAPLGADAALRRLGRRLRELRSSQLADLDRESVGDARVDAGLEAALELRDRLARNEGHALVVAVTAVVRGADGVALERGAASLRAAFAATLAGAEVADFEHATAVASTWPLALDASPRRKLVDSAGAATVVPFVEVTCDDRGGYLLGVARRSGAPVRLDLFDRGRYPNANVAVLAASGRGKSYALGALLLAAAARGRQAIVVDPEGEHERLVRALGGTYLHLRSGCPAALNVFDAATDGDPDGDAGARGDGGAVVALVDVLAGGRLDEVERARVDEATGRARAAARQQGRVPVLGDCVPALEATAPRVAAVLARFCSGPLGDLFNRPTTLDASAPLVGFGLRDLRDELVPAATFVLAEWLWALVRRDHRDRHIVVDEVGLLVAHAPLRILLAQLARRCRKYGASLVVATQNAGDLLADEAGRVIATNCAVVLLGGHRGAETARMQAAYSLTDAQRLWLEGASRGEFLLLAGTRRLPIRIDVSPLHHEVLTAAVDGAVSGPPREMSPAARSPGASPRRLSV